MKETIRFKLNDKPQKLSLDSDRTLLWVLRSDLDHTGAKYCCGEGYCGTCTVLVDNKPVRSCQFPMENVKGKEVLTIEGLEQNGKLHPLQQAFIEHSGLQCGFCTPGMIMNAYSLLKKNPRPTESDIIKAKEGNLCRCGAYSRIIEAIQTASKTIEGGQS
ncbi:MAG: (2Fe-2S)-binding protein [bacterium]|nr:(2Fe-2S)-binding protein [bacterium]